MTSRVTRPSRVQVGDPGNGRPRPTALWVSVAAGYFAVGATLQVLPAQLVAHPGVDPALVAWTGSAPFLLSALARIWAGRISDRGWADVVVTAGGVLVLLGVVLQLRDWSVTLVVVARVLMGFGQGMLSAGALPWVVAASAADRRGQAAARFGLSMWSGLAVGSLTASAIAGWNPALRHLVFEVAGGVGVLCALYGRASRGTRGSLRDPGQPRHPRGSTVARAGSYLGLISYGYGSAIGLLVLFMTARGFSASGCLGVFSGGFLVARIVASPQIDRHGAGLVGSACAATAACAFALLPVAPTAGAALVLVATAGAGVGLAYPCAVTIAFSMSSGARASAVATVTAWWDVGLVAGGGVSGLVVRQAGYDAAFALAAAAAGAALLTIAGVRPSSARTTSEAAG